jgi:hypothetical protein
MALMDLTTGPTFGHVSQDAVAIDAASLSKERVSQSGEINVLTAFERERPMQITITIADEQWEQFQEVAQEAVEQSWDGKYEDFATYIMAVNLETYIMAQQKKQEKKLKRALAEYEASMAKETMMSAQKPAVLSGEKAQTAPVKPHPSEKPHVAPSPENQEKAMTNTELSERIAQLEEVPVKKRTLAEAQELHDLLILRRKKATKK